MASEMFTITALNVPNGEPDSTCPEFWSQRYARGEARWQMNHLPKRLTVFLQSLGAGCNVLIPGCGEDFRTVEAFRRAGHRVTAIDFSAVAVDAMKKALPEMTDGIILGDFFTYNFLLAPFDLIYERTFLCSLPPRLWKNYARRVQELLKPRGKVAGLFFYGEEADPPPYPLTKSKASEIFESQFDLRTSETVADSLPLFVGNEQWQEWQLR